MQEQNTERKRQTEMMKQVEENQSNAISTMMTEKQKSESNVKQKEKMIKYLETELASLRESNGKLEMEKLI